MDPRIRYEALLAELREIYRFESNEKFTLKWIDDEGKLCISNKQGQILLQYIATVSLIDTSILSDK